MERLILHWPEYLAGVVLYGGGTIITYFALASLIA